MMLRSFSVLALVAAALLQQQPFKSGASTVAVYTTVTDGSGHIVTDLTRDQFEVFDQGQAQPISTFANDVQPITVVMMLDRSLSMLRNFSLVEQAAGAFVDRLLPTDKARIGSFSNRIEVDPREFTSDKEELHQILKMDLQEPGPTPLWNAVGVGMTALLHQEGRRVVLVFTDGMDSPMNGSVNNVSLKDVKKRSDEEDVMVYAIGLAGNSFGGFGGRHGGGGGRGGGWGGRGGGWSRGGGAHGRGDEPDPGLEKLAAASGGGYF